MKKLSLLNAWQHSILSLGPLVALAMGIAIPDAQASGKTVKVAYALDYTFASPTIANNWFAKVKQDFENAHPGDTMQLIPIPGGLDDFNTKLSLLFNSTSTAPDIVQVQSELVGAFAAAGVLAPLDDSLAKAPWYKDYPDAVKKEGFYQGHTYSIPQGLNTYGLLLDHTYLDKAGLPKDWAPKSWSDILDAARAVKKAAPDASPIFLMTGTAQGTFGVTAGPGVLLAASSNPMILNEKTNKWVVDSKGLREVLTFYKTASQEGLLAASSRIMDPNAPNNQDVLVPKHGAAIVFGGSWAPLTWGKQTCTPCWTDPDKTISFAKVPTIEGKEPGSASPFNSTDLIVYSQTSDPELTWSAVDIMQQRQNILAAVAGIGMVPASQALKTDPYYLGLTIAPFPAAFADVASNATAVPTRPEYAVWGNAFQQATQAMVLKPDMSVDDAIKLMTDFLTNQLGADLLETAN